MGIHYIVIPFESDGKLLDWLRSQGVEAPPDPISRYPSPRELRTVLDSLTGHTTEYYIVSNYWQATIYETAGSDPGPPLRVEGPNAAIDVVDFQGNESLPHEFHFDKSWPVLVVTILTRLASITGPLVLVDTSGVDPVVIRGGADVQQIMSSWKPMAS